MIISLCSLSGVGCTCLSHHVTSNQPAHNNINVLPCNALPCSLELVMGLLTMQRSLPCPVLATPSWQLGWCRWVVADGTIHSPPEPHTELLLSAAGVVGP
jgi:hypothetical protein